MAGKVYKKENNQENKSELAVAESNPFSNILQKSNYLISSVYRATLLENKVLALALSKVTPNSEGRPVAVLKTREIKGVLGVTGNAMSSYLKDVASSLAGRTMFVEAEDGSFKCMNLVGVVSYMSGSGTMEIKFEPEIKEYLFDLKANYTLLNLPLMLSFKSGWSYRLYELLLSKAYHTKYDKDKGNVFHITYNVSELKLLLGTVQIKDEKGRINSDIQRELNKKDKDYDHIVNDLVHEKLRSFDNWSDFKKRVLDVAVNEINEKADIQVSYRCLRSGRGGRIYGIDFEVIRSDLIVEKKEETPVVVPTEDELDSLADQVLQIIEERLKISEAKALLRAADYDVSRIARVYDLACKQKEIHNLMGWLMSALQNGYEDQMIHKVNGYTQEETEAFDEWLSQLHSAKGRQSFDGNPQ